MRLRYAALSDVGKVRRDNQDSGYAGPHLLVVADGVGGSARGDIASSATVEELRRLDAPPGDDMLGALAGAIHRTHDRIATLVAEKPEIEGTSSTVTAAIFDGARIGVGHVGDSRGYLFRDGAISQLTADHTFVQSLIDEGRITEDEAIGHPQRSLVTRVLTGQQDDEPDVTVREARIGDRYLIASDGLTDYVAGDTIAEMVLAGQPPGATADRLVDLALKAGAPDNVTIVIGDVVDLTKVAAPPTQPQIVGAAATRTRGTRPIPVTPAAKAAALSREASGEEDVEDVTSPRRARPRGRDAGCAWSPCCWSCSSSSVGARMPRTPGRSASTSSARTTATSPSTRG